MSKVFQDAPFACMQKAFDDDYEHDDDDDYFDISDEFFMTESIYTRRVLHALVTISDQPARVAGLAIF